jgi:hypothetical protein
MIRFLGIPLLVIASLLALAACNGKSSSNAAEQSSTAAEATAAAPTPTPDSPSTVYGVAVFPDAIVLPASTLNVHGANTTVLSTDEVYNEVLTWYDARNPGVPQSRSQGAVPSAVFKIKSGKNMITVKVSDTPNHSGSIMTYVRGKP